MRLPETEPPIPRPPFPSERPVGMVLSPGDLRLTVVEISGNREPNRSGDGTYGNRMRTEPAARPHGHGGTGNRRDRNRQATNRRYPTNAAPFGIPDSHYLTETNARKPAIVTFSILVELNYHYFLV